MLDLGYVEGQNLIIEERFVIGDPQLVVPAMEVASIPVEVILVVSFSAARAVQSVTTTIPIVSAGQGDLVAEGVVDSLGNPGGNVTGLSTPSLVSKQLQILQECMPALTRVAVFVDTTNPVVPGEVYEAPARALGLRLQFIGAGKPEEVESAFEAAAQQRAEAIFVLQGPGIGFNQTRIAELAVQHRLPSMWGQSDAIARGGLLGYGANRIDLHRRAAGYVDKILKGARPADLPIELPSQFDFPINLKTAQALGLTIPQSVLSQATELIQ
jgi:ABC-type uncharacterized transport system substrate-binding protein